MSHSQTRPDQAETYQGVHRVGNPPARGCWPNDTDCGLRRRREQNGRKDGSGGGGKMHDAGEERDRMRKEKFVGIEG